MWLSKKCLKVKKNTLWEIKYSGFIFSPLDNFSIFTSDFTAVVFHNIYMMIHQPELKHKLFTETQRVNIWCSLHTVFKKGDEAGKQAYWFKKQKKKRGKKKQYNATFYIKSQGNQKDMAKYHPDIKVDIHIVTKDLHEFIKWNIVTKLISRNNNKRKCLVQVSHTPLDF